MSASSNTYVKVLTLTQPVTDPIIAFWNVDFYSQQWFDQDDNPVTLELFHGSPDTVVSGNELRDGDPATYNSDKSANGSMIAHGTFTELRVHYTQIGAGGGGTDAHKLGVFANWSCPQTVDTDGDGVIDSHDLDSDNDGIPDNVESFRTEDYIPPSGTLNLNGIDTAYALLHTKGVTSDIDDVLDHLDSDSDNDGISDCVESMSAVANCPVNIADVGVNGLVDWAESADDYSDINGLAHDGSIFFLDDTDNDVADDGSDAEWLYNDFDFRDQTPSVTALDNIDTDNDGYIDSFDLDDDNDGILDTDEVTCGYATTTNTTIVHTVGSQEVSGTYTLAGATGTYTIDLSDSNRASTAGHQYDGNGVSYQFSQLALSMTTFATITPDPGSSPTQILWGPDLQNKNDAYYYTDAQVITLTWEGGFTATVQDPNNQLVEATGTVLYPGDTITTKFATLNGSGTWYIVFDLKGSTIPFRFRIDQYNAAANLSLEGFSFKFSACADDKFRRRQHHRVVGSRIGRGPLFRFDRRQCSVYQSKHQ
ncbi:MAG: hypothetical protein R3A47_05670 [Polyangiales bacterium]